MEPVKRKAGRPPSQSLSEKPGPPLRITVDADRILTQQAKKLKVSKTKYASAAITFFAQSGLDPTKELPADLAAIGQKVEGGVANVRTHNADIGNRLFALTRSFEKTIYQFMQQQESVMTKYLEGIEGNIMRRLVSMEDNLLRPLIERAMRGAQDAYIGRGIGTRIYLELMKQPGTLWEGQDDQLNKEREQVLVEELRKFMTSHVIPPAKSTLRPAATPVPAPAPLPPKPVAQAAVPAPTTTPPKS